MERLIGLLCLLALIVGCAAPSPTPTPTPMPGKWPYLNDEVRLYLILIEPYTSIEVILMAPDMPAATLKVIASRMEGIVPPAELEEAHVKLVKGYQFLYEGRAILETYPRPELRAEGVFMQDWGVKTLREHQEMVFEYVQSQRLKRR